MPFKSKAQQRYMFAAEARGELPKGTAKRWADETKSFKKLPERVKRKGRKMDKAAQDQEYAGRIFAQGVIHELEKAGAATYPISRFFTNPHTWGGIQAAAMLPVAPLGYGLQYGIWRGKRFVGARGMAGRLARGGKGMTKAEKKTVDLVRAQKSVALPAAAAASVGVAGGAAAVSSVKGKGRAKAALLKELSKEAAGKTYPISRFISNPLGVGTVKGTALGGANLAASGAEAAAIAAPAGLVGGGIGAMIHRFIGHRGFRGRVARGGKGLYGAEKKLVEQIQKGKTRKAVVAGGAAGAAGGAGLAALTSMGE